MNDRTATTSSTAPPPPLDAGTPSDVLPGWHVTPFTALGRTKDVFVAGEGPGIVVMPEIPGITPDVAAFGWRLVERGYSVAIPDLFGTPGKPLSVPRALAVIARSCVSKEFHALAARRSSPATDWLRVLCRALHANAGGVGVGAIGMCFTGNFALALMVDPVVMAPVLSQPSMPFPMGAERRRGLHVSDAELKAAVDREDRCPVLAMRFTGDPMVPAARFEALRDAFGERARTIEIDSSRGNPHGNPREAHSVVTTHLVDEEGHPTREALDTVLAFFDERLRLGAETA